MPRFGSIGTQYFDSSGDPLTSGKLYFYERATTNPIDTYSNEEMTIANTNPVVLTADGRQPNIFFSGEVKVVLKDQDDAQVEVRDPVGSTASLSASDVKSLYESNSDTNAFTNTEKDKLSTVAASANNYTHPNHSGDVTSTADGAQVIDKTAITGKDSVTPAGDDTLLISDTSDSGNLKETTVGEVAQSPVLDYTGLADNEYVGATVDMVAGGTVDSHAAVGRSNASNSRYVTHAFDSAAITNAAAIGITTNTSSAALDDDVTVLLHGFMRDDSWSWTVGDILYVGTGGALTATRPVSGYRCAVAIAMTSSIIFVRPGHAEPA